ncbi:MAG: UDP-N-acetylmuramate--L-alanine ligase [Gemmatimonadetes bacterium]|nr:UDP-N-acetylmuramate--L-alanine ligase [Gemmatimonadota bacterium]
MTCRHAHFIGIGGIGMSALAELMLGDGYKVSGSDLRGTLLTERLHGLGASVFQGHDPANAEGADLIVYSSAISGDNPELAAARRLGRRTISRAELLGIVMRGTQGIAVAGTHGKTSTSAMIVKVLAAAGLDPTAVIGGVMTENGSTVRRGNGPWMIAEADEYDRSFHALTPAMAVITSVDADHMEYYGSQEAIDEAFTFFAHLVPEDRPLIVCADDPGIRRIQSGLARRLVTYGLSAHACIRADRVESKGWSVSAEVYVRDVPAGRLVLPQPGECNLSNALAAIAVGDDLELPVERTMAALSEYRGLKRRFEVLGSIGGVTVVDDYAHHPVEIEAALRAVSNAGARRMFVVFQPHLYSRTRNLRREFGRVLGRFPAYRTIVTDVYASRETPRDGVTGEMIVHDASAFDANVAYIPDKDRVAAALVDDLEPGDLVLTLGAGDIGEVGSQVCELLRKNGVRSHGNC